jgi:hypothetical protein
MNEEIAGPAAQIRGTSGNDSPGLKRLRRVSKIKTTDFLPYREIRLTERDS